MKEIYIRDAAQQENKVVSACFLVTAKQLKPKKNGEPYLDLTLSDCSGQITAKMWDNVAPASERFDVTTSSGPRAFSTATTGVFSSPSA